MDTPIQTPPITNPTAPPVVVPPPAAPAPVAVPVTPAPKTRNYTPIIIAMAVTILLALGAFYGISRMRQNEAVVAPTPTPTNVPTPTPIRQPSLIASDSAFIQFQSTVATLSAAIAGYSPLDPSLTPPTLILPLGFSR